MSELDSNSVGVPEPLLLRVDQNFNSKLTDKIVFSRKEFYFQVFYDFIGLTTFTRDGDIVYFRIFKFYEIGSR